MRYEYILDNLVDELCVKKMNLICCGYKAGNGDRNKICGGLHVCSEQVRDIFHIVKKAGKLGQSNNVFVKVNYGEWSADEWARLWRD